MAKFLREGDFSEVVKQALDVFLGLDRPTRLLMNPTIVRNAKAILEPQRAVQKPVFAVVGKNDPRVPWTESRQMLDKLKGNGITTWFLMANDEGHGYNKKKNQDFLFYATVMFVRQFLLGENVSAAAK